MTTPLSIEEQETLSHHLSVIKVSFALMVKSIAMIHAQKLYRGIDGNQTWAEFCRKSLNFSERYGHYFCEAFTILETIETHNATDPNPLPLPSKEAQTRALSNISEELIIPVWEAVTAKYGDNATAKNIYTVAKDVTVKEALIMKGVSDADVLESLSTLAEKSEHGRTIVTELLTTGYLQPGEDEDAIPLSELRIADLRHYEDNQRKEAIARRIADSGGVTLVIYPTDPQRTAGILLASMTSEQAYDLLACMEYNRRGYPYPKETPPKN